MIQTINVREGWVRYKSYEPIPSGSYFIWPRGSKPTTEIKRALGMLPASPPAGGFCWLVPASPWVRRVLLGSFDPTPPSVPVDWSIVGIDPACLYPHQKELIEAAWSAVAAGGQFRKGAVWSLGAGKTLFGLALCNLGEHPAVLAPKYLHETWKSEAEKWKVQIPLISTYESAHKLPKNVDVLVVDEIMCAKNPEALRSRKIREVSERATIAVGLTGTPTGGGGVLDWRWLDVLSPGSVPERDVNWRFLFGLDTTLEEVAPGRQAYVTKTWDEKKVAKFVAPFIDVVKADSLTACLPPIQFRTIKLPQPKSFLQIRMGVASDTTRSKVLAQARQCSDGFVLRDDGTPVHLSTEKLDAIEAFVEATGEPILLMAAWDESVTLLASRFESRKPSVIRGGMTEEDLGLAIRRFKEGETDLLIANARFSQGMNLMERCRVIAFMSWSSNPTDRTQALGRVYRPGQRNGVVAVDFVCEGTLDERTLELISGHTELSERQVENLLLKELK